MDEETTAAIARVARAFPSPDPALIEAAREEFAKQLDGTHAAKRKADFDEFVDTYFAAWPQNPFADAMKAGFSHVLEFIACPAVYEEADRARAALAAARSHTAGDLDRELIVEQLLLMVEKLDVIPDYSLKMDGGPEDVRTFSADVERALRQLMNFADNRQEQHLVHFWDKLESAAECRPPSTNAARDFEIVMAQLRFIGACLDPRPDLR
ncbi:MAG: hypothetical protein R2763_01375 [Mycobacterium sp.]